MKNQKIDTSTLIVFDSKENKLTQFRNNGQPIGSQWHIVGANSEFIADCFCDLWNLLLHKDTYTNSSIKDEYNKFLTCIYIFQDRNSFNIGIHKKI